MKQIHKYKIKKQKYAISPYSRYRTPALMTRSENTWKDKQILVAMVFLLNMLLKMLPLPETQGTNAKCKKCLLSTCRSVSIWTDVLPFLL